MISTQEQLSSAAERLGVKLGDLQQEFRNRITLSAPRNHLAATPLSQTDTIRKAFNESLFSICERAFDNSSSHGSSFSPGYCTPLSPDSLDSPQHADYNSAASASSSAAAQLQSNSKSNVEVLTLSCQNASEDDSAQPRPQGSRREITRAGTSPKSAYDRTKLQPSTLGTSPFNSSCKSPSQSPSTNPIGYILSFARGKQLSLNCVSDLDERHALRKMRSLSIIPGCDKYTDLCLFKYVKALFKAHLNLIQDLQQDQRGKATFVEDLKCEIIETSWRAIFAGDTKGAPTSEELSENIPPIIRNTVDLFQFTYRLLDRMSNASDSLTRGFLEGLYASRTPELVASLTSRLLSKWAYAYRNAPSFPQQKPLLEWCIRLLTGFIVYELSPVSQFRHMKDISPESSVVFNLGRGSLPPLSMVVDYCFQFVTSHQVGKDCRIALCELLQAYIIWSTSRTSEVGVRAQIRRETQEAREEYLESLVGKETFWNIVVHPALQQVKKQPQLSDSCFDYTFLSSLVSLAAAKRSLFDERQDKSKRMLLDVMIRNLELLNRDLLSCFVEAERHRKLYPGIHTSIDFIHRLIASAAVQREILSADSATKGRFLSSLEQLIANAAKATRSSLEVGESLEYARNGPFGKIPTDLGSCEPDSDLEDILITSKNGNEQKNELDQVLVQEKAVSFAAKLIGCLGKSVEDGSWDMSQMNSIKALFQARINSSRTRQRLWNDIYKIQRGVEKRVGTEVLLSTPERSSFAMVVEVVRKNILCDATYRDIGFPAEENSSGSQTFPAARMTRDVDATFPPVWDVAELKYSVCSTQGYTDFDNDRDLLMFMKTVLTERGQQMQARYDPESPFTVKWIRLQKRNSYIGRARELLDKADRTVGQRCSCVPGYPKENGNGNESRVACSNDLCENRHMKIECVPGKCGSGSYCMNQRMQKLQYAKFKMIPFQGKGVGIVADENVPEGALVGEYQGEVVTMEEYERRVQEYEGERHFYFMTLTNKLVIDASRKSQATRFLNHSCDPNSETQKWNADGEPRVGIFAKRAIPKGEEITFDYGARSLTQYSAQCLCGSKNCRGLLAVRKEEIGTPKGLVREGLTKSDTCAEITEEKASTSPMRERSRKLEEDRRDSIVKEKITVAKRYLHEAAMLSRKADESLPFKRDRKLNDDMQQKLNLWKLSVTRRSGVSAVLEQGFENSQQEVRFPRIPRRTTLLAKDGKNAAGKSRNESTEGNNSTQRLSVSADVEPLAISQNVRSSVANRRESSAGRWALFEETVAGKLGSSHTSLKRQAEGDRIRRPSKIPRASFLPTTSKLKKQPLRPKFAKRKRTRDQDEHDSMGEYSTASEAEPILDEPTMSPSRLPDGNGACSDDEFIAAPPVESIHVSPTNRRWNPSDYERRRFNERQIDLSEFDRKGEQLGGDGKFRFGSSHRLARKRSDPNLNLHVRSRHEYHLQGAQERSRPGKADLRGAGTHRTDLLDPTRDGRRYLGYHERTPLKERIIWPDSGDEDRQDAHASEEFDHVNHHPRQRVFSNSRSLGQKIHDTAYKTSRSRYAEALEASPLHRATEGRNEGNAPPSHQDDHQECSRMTAGDIRKRMLGKFGSAKLGSADSDFRSRAQRDADHRVSSRKERLQRCFLDDKNAVLSQPCHDVPDQTRIPAPATSQIAATSADSRLRGNRMYTFLAKNERRRGPSQRPEDRKKVDLRNVIEGRSQQKYR